MRWLLIGEGGGGGKEDTAGGSSTLIVARQAIEGRFQVHHDGLLVVTTSDLGQVEPKSVNHCIVSTAKEVLETPASHAMVRAGDEVDRHATAMALVAMESKESLVVMEVLLQGAAVGCNREA